VIFLLNHHPFIRAEQPKKSVKIGNFLNCFMLLLDIVIITENTSIIDLRLRIKKHIRTHPHIHRFAFLPQFSLKFSFCGEHDARCSYFFVICVKICFVFFSLCLLFIKSHINRCLNTVDIILFFKFCDPNSWPQLCMQPKCSQLMSQVC